MWYYTIIFTALLLKHTLSYSAQHHHLYNLARKSRQFKPYPVDFSRR